MIDGSASFRRIALGRALPHLISVFSGLLSVTSADHPLSVAVSGAEPRVAPVDRPTRLVGAVDELVRSVPLASGARLGEPELHSREPAARAVHWIVTDGVPADAPALAALGAAAGIAMHVVIIGDQSLLGSGGLDRVPATLVDEVQLIGLADPARPQPVRPLAAAGVLRAGDRRIREEPAMTAKCPLCFSIVDPSVKAWKCVSGQCELDEDDRALSDAYGTAVRDVPRIATSKAVQDASTPRGAWPPRTPFCPSCKSPMAEICAVCHWVLPEDWSAANVTTIAMAGARASGKSFFIAVGLTELEQLLLAHAHTQLQPFSPEVARVFRESYIEPLYVRLGVLEPTPEGTRQGAYQRQPLVFDLGQVNRRRQYLVMRDVAGEELQELKPERRHLGFLGRADAVLFLFDPLAVPEVRSSLRDVIPLPDDTGANPVAVLTNLTMLIREATAAMPCRRSG